MKKVLLIDCGSSKVPKIQHFLNREFEEVRTIQMEAQRSIELEEKLSWADAVVISGAPILLSKKDVSAYLEWFQWLHEIKKPVLGICFGHQIIGLSFGAKIRLGKERRKECMIKLLAFDSIFSGLDDAVKVSQDHCEDINLPEQFDLMAHSHQCEVEAMKHSSLPIFGVQFHPEVSSTIGSILFHNFASLKQ